MIAIPTQMDRRRARLCPRVVALVHGGRTREGLRKALEDEGIWVREFGCGDAVREQISRFGPDVVLVGSRAGADRDDDQNGLLERLSAGDPPWQLIYLAPDREPDTALEALLRGADDVITPPHSASAILLRARVLRAKANGDPRRPVDTVSRGQELRIDVEGRRVTGEAGPVDLTVREFQLLCRLLDADGDVVKREALLRDVWGVDQSSYAVLDATVHRLRRKLESDVAAPQVITTVRGVGYRLELDQLAAA